MWYIYKIYYFELCLSLELLVLRRIWGLGPRLATNGELFEINWSGMNDCASWLRVGLCMTCLMPLIRPDLKLIFMYSGFRNQTQMYFEDKFELCFGSSQSNLVIIETIGYE